MGCLDLSLALFLSWIHLVRLPGEPSRSDLHTMSTQPHLVLPNSPGTVTLPWDSPELPYTHHPVIGNKPVSTTCSHHSIIEWLCIFFSYYLATFTPAQFSGAFFCAFVPQQHRQPICLDGLPYTWQASQSSSFPFFQQWAKGVLRCAFWHVFCTFEVPLNNNGTTTRCIFWWDICAVPKTRPKIHVPKNLSCECVPSLLFFNLAFLLKKPHGLWRNTSVRS